MQLGGDFDEEGFEENDENERELPEAEAIEQDNLDEGQGEPERQEDESGDAEDDPERDEGEDDKERPDDLAARRRDDDGLNSRQRRSQTRYQKLEADKRAAEEKAARLEAEAEQLRAYQQREQALELQKQQQAREQRLATMLPEERLGYEIQEVRAQIAYQDQLRKFEAADARDAAEYNAQAKINPVYARHAKAVENSLAQLRKAGQNMPRDVLLRYHIGEEMLKTSQKNSKAQAPAQKRKVPKPSNSRADASNTQGRRKPTSEKQRILDTWGDTPI
jgi:hypothetical protein